MAALKVAIVSFSHFDSVIPLSKALSKFVDIDLYGVFARNYNMSSIINLGETLRCGLMDLDVAGMLDEEIEDYIAKTFKFKLFIYENLKIRSLANWRLSIAFSKILRQYDVIHFNGTNAVLPLLYVLLNRKKKVFTIHDYDSHSGEVARFDLSGKFNRFVVRSSWPVVLQNKTDFNRIKEEEKRTPNLYYIPFGVLDIYHQYLKDLNKSKGYDLLFFGRISPYKGIEYLVDAVNQLGKKNIKVRVCLAGKGEYYFDATGIENDPAFTIINRYISNSELVSLINKSKIIVCPYTDATQSGVAMTAFAFNKPVIASAVGGFVDVIQDNVTGKLVPAKNSTALADAIYDLLNNAGKRLDMERNIQSFSENSDFSWETIARRYNEIYI